MTGQAAAVPFHYLSVCALQPASQGINYPFGLRLRGEVGFCFLATLPKQSPRREERLRHRSQFSREPALRALLCILGSALSSGCTAISGAPAAAAALRLLSCSVCSLHRSFKVLRLCLQELRHCPLAAATA